ncbi:MAG: hypothetical protein FJ368_04170 [Pelagibacterales bacterium]|nr:hypothetical protein [Pelagibacterales bacterium]
MYYSRKRRRSKKLFSALVILASILFLATGFFINRNSSGLLVAKVNEQKIYKTEIGAKLHDIFSGQNSSVKTPEIEKLPKEVLEILVKEIYLEKELVKKAQSEGLEKDPEIKSQIEQAKNKILRHAYLNKLTSEAATEEKVNNRYLELTKDLEGKKEYQISHILVKTKEEAEDILQKLKKSKFAELAKKYSIDKESASNGGNLEFMVEDNLVKEIAESVSSLKVNEVSHPIQTKFGWHIIKLNEVKEANLPAFESIKESIREQIKHNIANETNSRITKDIKIKILIKLEPELEEDSKQEIPTTNADNAVESNLESSSNEQNTEKVTTSQDSKKIKNENSSEEHEIKQENKEEEKASSKEKNNAKKSN